MLNGVSRSRGRTALGACALAVTAIVAPVALSAGVAAGLTAQTITFGALSDRTLNEAALVVTASASSGLPVTFTSVTPLVCSSTGTNGATISPNIEGTCTVRAAQMGNGTFAAAPSVDRSFTVTKGSQAITFAPLSDATLGGLPVVVSATASTGFPVTFTTTTPAVCTSGGTHGATITLVAGGTCTVQADQAGNAIFAAAPSVQQSFGVSKAAQTITFGALANRTTLQSPVTVSAVSSSLLPVMFSTTTPAVCTSTGTNGATIDLVGPGTCTVRADQPGDPTFDAAAPVSRSFTVTRVAQTITFGVLADRATTPSPFTVSATASSGLAVNFTSPTPGVCSTGGTHGATVTLLGAGTCTVVAHQPGDTIYNIAPAVGQSFTVTKTGQTINFGALADAPPGTDVTVGATATSGLAVSFTTTTAAVCTAGGTNGKTITLLTAGKCTVQADQAGNAIYAAAPPVAQSFTVVRADQTITFATLPAATLAESPLTVAATASSGLAVVFTTTTPAVCTAGGANGSAITLLKAGQCTVHAAQPGTTGYNAAPPVERSFTVSKSTQHISFPALADVTYPHAPLTLHATSSSKLPVTFAATTPSVCHTFGSGGTRISVVAVGVCTIRAEQAGNSAYDPAPAVTRTFTVSTPVVSQGNHSGYWMLGADGHVYAFGSAPDHGSATSLSVAFAARPDGGGYWIVDWAGNVHAFGSAQYRGGKPLLRRGEIVSTISGTPTGNGYWLFTNLGRAFAFGDAKFYGDMNFVHLNGFIVASTATPTGHGYYMVGSDGGVFSFGDAKFHGSMGGSHLNQPIVGLSPTPDNGGYWLVASDGGVFAFDAPFRGSLGSVSLNRPVNGLVAFGNGYLMVASDGGVFDFSDRAFAGSLGGTPPPAPIVGIAAFTGR